MRKRFFQSRRPNGFWKKGVIPLIPLVVVAVIVSTMAVSLIYNQQRRTYQSKAVVTYGNCCNTNFDCPSGQSCNGVSTIICAQAGYYQTCTINPTRVPTLTPTPTRRPTLTPVPPPCYDAGHNTPVGSCCVVYGGKCENSGGVSSCNTNVNCVNSPTPIPRNTNTPTPVRKCSDGTSVGHCCRLIPGTSCQMYGSYALCILDYHCKGPPPSVTQPPPPPPPGDTCGKNAAGACEGTCSGGKECKKNDTYNTCNCVNPPGCSQPTCSGTLQAPACIPLGGSITVKISGEDKAHGGVKFPTWSDPYGQDDIVWYNGTEESPHVWSANIPQSAHTGGNINVNAYLYNQCNQPFFCAGKNIPRCTTPTPIKTKTPTPIKSKTPTPTKIKTPTPTPIGSGCGALCNLPGQPACRPGFICLNNICRQELCPADPDCDCKTPTPTKTKTPTPTSPFVTSPPVCKSTDVSVIAAAIPNSGARPLNNVDLKATVGGTKTGPITYRFNCNADGVWDKTVTTNTNPYRATDLCNYSSSGYKTARVWVTRGGCSATDTVIISVGVPTPTKTKTPTPTPGGATNTPRPSTKTPTPIPGSTTIPTLTKTPTPIPTAGPNAAKLKFNVQLPDIAVSTTNIPATNVQLELTDGTISAGVANVDLVRNGNYFETASDAAFDINQNVAFYTILVKTKTSLRRSFTGVTLTQSQTLDCTVASAVNCGELITERDIKLLFSGDSDGFNTGSGSYNRIDSADLQVLATYFNQAATAEASAADFNIDSQVDISDLEILGRNYGQQGD